MSTSKCSNLKEGSNFYLKANTLVAITLIRTSSNCASMSRRAKENH